jgi:hypothetical protein
MQESAVLISQRVPDIRLAAKSQADWDHRNNLYSDSKEWYLDAYISRLRPGMKDGKVPAGGPEEEHRTSRPRFRLDGVVQGFDSGLD